MCLRTGCRADGDDKLARCHQCSYDVADASTTDRRWWCFCHAGALLMAIRTQFLSIISKKQMANAKTIKIKKKAKTNRNEWEMQNLYKKQHNKKQNKRSWWNMFLLWLKYIEYLLHTSDLCFLTFLAKALLCCKFGSFCFMTGLSIWTLTWGRVTWGPGNIEC